MQTKLISNKEQLSKKIKEFKQKHNISQKDFANMIGISSTHLSRIEAGINSTSIQTGTKILTLIKTAPADVIKSFNSKPLKLPKSLKLSKFDVLMQEATLRIENLENKINTLGLKKAAIETEIKDLTNELKRFRRIMQCQTN